MRLFGKLFATALVLLLLCLTIVLTLMHTRHATSLVSYALNTFSSYSITASSVNYNFTDPWHLTISDINLKDPQQDSISFTTKELQIWLTPNKLFKPGWHFDTILIDGLSLTPDSSLPALPPLYTNRLALTRFNLQSPELTIKNSKLQLNNWRSEPQPWPQFTGDFQLAAKKIRWQDTTLNNVLLDGNHNQQHWIIYGFSFNWQQANFNGQAEYLNKTKAETLILHQLTVSDLKLQDNRPLGIQPAHRLATRFKHPSELPSIIDIRRLDILNSSLELPELTLNNADLSLQNWHWPTTHWQQQNAHFSLNADSLRWHNTVFEDPLVELAFSPQQMIIEGISAKVMEGYIQTDGTLTPDTLALNQLTINSIKWFLPEQWPAQLQTASRRFENIRLAALDIGYAQFIDTHPERHFQLSDLNLSGHDLIFQHHGQPGLWQGELTASAGFASIKTIAMVEPLMTMHSQNGQWQLSELTVPFRSNGILEAKGSLNLRQDGHPWQLHLTTDSMPATALSQWLALPLPVSGAMDIELSANGLSQHTTSLAYSFEGKLDGKFRQLQLKQHSTSQLWAQWSEMEKPIFATSQKMKSQQVSASELHLRADRGRISLAPISLQATDFNATLKGQWDLAKPNGREIKLQATQGCQQLIKEWRGAQQQISQSSSCDGSSI
ncbi:AsmA family protein [uncultured Photobacterium sp.]|uniref:AsmA family protein n=1 Tax=uncultured Photobacterium sp. TaxID=173973 RepID=UPI0026078EB6|nr:AsmA family protein [uncultured Photobacterium sp.]